MSPTAWRGRLAAFGDAVRFAPPAAAAALSSLEDADMACNRITAAFASERPIKAVLDSYNPVGSLHARTACPGWLGERLDVGWAIDVLHPLAAGPSPISQ